MEEPSARSALESERVSASDRVHTLRTELAWLAGDSDDANGDDEHDPEGSTVAFERARVAALLTDAESNLKDLDWALTKLEAGSYSVCEVCGREIARERLEALPATRSCVVCATATHDS
jgi:RNA polymerase-binding transcription factor DksA